MWKERVEKYYLDCFEQYGTEYLAYRKEDKEYSAWLNREGFKLRRDNRAEYDRISKEHKEKENAFRSRWNFITPYVEWKWNAENTPVKTFDLEKLRKMLEREADAKYDFIIERTNAITGKITDATNLSVGGKGDLNGYIIGEKGTAKVNTIGAGGHNIQCFHFRTLIHEK